MWQIDVRVCDVCTRSSSKGHRGETQAPGGGGRQLLLEPLQQGQERRKMQSAFGKLQENPVVSMCSNRIYCAIIYLFKDVNITLCLIEKMGS